MHKYFFFFFQNKGKKTPSDRRVVYFMRWLPLINPPWIMRCNPAGDWSHFSKTLIAICCAEEIIMLSRAVFCDLPPGALVAAHYLFCGSAFTDRSPSKLVWDILWPANFVGLIRLSLKLRPSSSFFSARYLPSVLFSTTVSPLMNYYSALSVPCDLKFGLWCSRGWWWGGSSNIHMGGAKSVRKFPIGIWWSDSLSRTDTKP